ncbi:DUF1499 domain-containing protein [Desulforhopalus sp. IMCC35007]|uniref:DUF1499 domain-containing protein n=1 Tax=Desulforhopalus sp. IMCC35007 TaxID=2569543 RepID=UPI0010AEBC84|nr:DUF1499 domain-containing protein [Desulforhopalus sp. IMCC35007]TKB11809.1 DUF1499 domain-containing protein [Desulforhopalus sp. IMCC35007]
MDKQSRVAVISCLLCLLISGCTGTGPELGVVGGILTPCPPRPNCVNSQATDEDHMILPFRYAGTEQEARGRLLQVLESEDRAKVIAANDNYVRAEFTSPLFRFVDDVEFYIYTTSAGETVIDVRSASRLGYSDLGANRKRIERLHSKCILGQ